MKKKLPPLNWIRSFEAAARHLSFTHAAVELNLSQAAISQQIKGLEHQLGTVLFKRLPRGLELTNAGAAYLPIVHESVERLRVATEEIFGQGRTNLLTIKVNLVFFMNWLAPKISDFRITYPEINLRITSNIWINDKDTPSDNDFEIRYGKGKWKGLQAERLTWDNLLPVCSPNYLNSNAPLITPNDLANHTLLHVIGYEDGWGYWLNQTNHEHLKISQGFQFDTLITALEMAILGEGIALGRTSLVDEMLSSGKLIAPFKEQIATDEAFYLAYASSNLIHPHANKFKEWILNKIDKK
ncbi:LysR family transcriptional regulator, glycine cleavage system transcriptional activator [Glaciecola punicea ACAM 611]|jgi:LysR family glycine cleavage system transcriptional activator|uniref:LysR family transcriptional regulator, glycine cleavage system transcriptional activator n=1 Tax=Glaciecola punicea ACAM 611 TaxID=1121923 RepID=H5TAW3_9ALTE|nr:transcriptional regulator GcvA [Glaciecola punicea]GAB55440.1 LysR family transcriptional regulator, glycine cleavage system transcriptional activator [Glaciecola punicea ACAM 611]